MLQLFELFFYIVDSGSRNQQYKKKRLATAGKWISKNTQAIRSKNLKPMLKTFNK
jgi:hypothetical protein